MIESLATVISELTKGEIETILIGTFTVLAIGLLFLFCYFMCLSYFKQDRVLNYKDSKFLMFFAHVTSASFAIAISSGLVLQFRGQPTEVLMAGIEPFIYLAAFSMAVLVIGGIIISSSAKKTV